MGLEVANYEQYIHNPWWFMNDEFMATKGLL
jgi:hypothetical protein